MKTHTPTKVVAVILSVLMLLSVVPMTAYASEWSDNNVVFSGSSFGTNGYYNVISKKDYTLVPGAAVESEMVLNNNAGNRRQVMHIIEVDPSNPDVSIVPGYYNIDKDLTDVNNQKAAGVTDVVKYYEDDLGYNVVGAMNTSLAYDCNAPIDYLVYNGVNLSRGKHNAKTFLAVIKDPETGKISCELHNYSDGIPKNCWQAVSANFGFTVKDGALVSKTEERTTSAAARSMIGVKEDGTLVLVMNDGRGANNSVGFCDYELGESMLALGCKWAVNCDGGGSSSFVTKRAGESTGTMRCVPCDGAERPTINSILITSNVAPTGELHNVNINSDYDYFAPGTSYTFEPEAIDTHGYAMDMPADATWALSNASFGSVNNGTFTSNGTTGDVDIQVVSGTKPLSDRTVLFTNSAYLSDVYIYYYSDDNGNMVQWPGVPMAEYDINDFGEKRYYFELPNGATKFVINNGLNNDQPGSYQTSDLTFNGKTGVYIDNDNVARPYSIDDITVPNIVGSKTIHIANPTTLNLSATETTVPYSTPDKIRTINLPMVAKIGENDVFTAGTYNISVSPSNGGTVDGLKFTATDDTSVSKAVVTINYAPTSQSFTYTVNYGKGSEVLWDYEDGDISAWTGTEDTEQYMRDHGAEIATYGDFTTPFKTLAAGGQISWSNTTTTKLSSVAEGGKAHGGDKALAVTFNMKNVEFNSWVYSIIWNTQGNTVLRDVANGNNATAIGCWVYVPKGFYTVKNNGAQALQLTVQKGPDANTLSGTQLNLQYNGKNINALKESDIPENRWVYVKASLTANNYVKLVDPVNDVYRSASIMRMYVKPSEAQEMTYYFDDWTLDYSSAVDDREPPVISNPTYCSHDENIAFAGQTVDTNVLSFNANVADYAASNAEGLDYDSAMIYVDGVAQRNVSASGNTMGIQNVVLSNGVHNIKFEIADKLGNSTTLTKTLTVNADGAKPAVRLAGHNDKNNTIEAGSVYYVDVKADAIESIDSVTTTIDLQSAHEWELDNIITAPGFEASYELNTIKDNVATVTITKTGATTLTGEQTIASLPVRVWSYDESTFAGGDGTAPVHYTAAQRYASSYGEPVLMMEANVLYGEVGYTDNTTGTFGGSISEATAVTGNKTKAWHEHDAELTVQNKAATCTEDGYTNRTYCETCGSVVDWGTKIPATGHNYEFVDGQFVCSVCDDVYQPGTGLFEMNGHTYYAINNNIMHGWQQIDDNWYYFRSSTYQAAEGVVNFNFGTIPVSFEFDNGRMLEGQWVETQSGTRYYNGPVAYTRTWAEIDGKTYYFDENSNLVRGYFIIKDSRYSHDDDYRMYKFNDETGELEETLTSTGLLETPDGKYYLENGYAKHGLFQVDNDYYYFNSTHKAVTGNYYVSEVNGLNFNPGYYDFDNDGKMIVKNGIVEENGALYYYENGEKTYAGLIEIDGALYYVHSQGNVATGETWVTKTNDLVDAQGYYLFGDDGKMIDTGIYEVDGALYYFKNGKKAYAGLVEIDGALYYVHSQGNVATGETWVTKTNGLVESQGYYLFGDDGKMVQTGVYNVDGTLYYFENGKKTYGGLVNIGNDYYYAHSQGNVATGETWVTKTNGLVESQGYYLFGDDGKMVHTGVYDVDGTLYYFENGKKTYAGLINIDGALYYVHSQGNVATGKTWVTKTNDLVPAQGYYIFDDDGKMIVK